MSDDVVQLADEFRRALLKRERKAAVRMVEAYGRIWNRLAKNLAILNQEIAAARARSEIVNQSWLYRQRRFGDLLRQVDAEFKRFEAIAETTITKQQEIAATNGLNHSFTLMTTAAESAGIAVTFNKLPTSAVENMVGFLSNGAPLRTLLDQLPREARQIVEQGLIEGVALGKNPTAIARVIRRGLGGNLNRALIISRTETLRAFRTASLMTYRANQDVVRAWRWNASKSRRTCLNCLSRDGSIYPLTKPMPAHPRCRCSFTPILIGADLPQTETGTEWFERQPDDIKQEMMGPKAFDLYKAGKVSLKDFEGERFSPLWGATTYQRSVKEIQGQRQIKSAIAVF